jgi:16S rRNA G966 N2-methylase RsmD
MIKANEIQIVSIKDVKLNPKNRNKHPKEQIERLSEIIKYQGFRNPLIISSRTGLVVAGHGRYEAAKKLKLKEVPVMVQDFDSEEQEYAAQVSDNAIAAWAELDLSGINTDLGDLGPDFNIDLLGIKDFVLEPAELIPQCDEDEVPEHVEPKTKLGDIYQLGRHRLMCGSSTAVTDVERLINMQAIDLVFTDPPYGVNAVKGGMVGAEFGVAKKGRYKEIIADDTTDCAKEFYQACTASGLRDMIIWGGNYFTEFLPPSKSWVIWNKRDKTEITNTFADGEMAWSNLGHPVRIHGQLWNGMIRSGEKGKRVHPTQKPIALAEFCFDLKKDVATVFDGFGGSGSTLIACEKTNRTCFMMELDPHYVDIIVARYCKYTGANTVILNGDTVEV